MGSLQVPKSKNMTIRLIGLYISLKYESVRVWLFVLYVSVLPCDGLVTCPGCTTLSPSDHWGHQTPYNQRQAGINNRSMKGLFVGKCSLEMKPERIICSIRICIKQSKKAQHKHYNIKSMYCKETQIKNPLKGTAYL
ncbi:hypothetical protein AMECASPLE_016688 [Ameca splendens]|uniref:Uncharacterized protein n=1 Tax=Ameca splendens TaxID=208324 RepID=A0ABV0Z1D6_9TELE